MIVLNLCCSHDHRFEGWFASVEAFDDQAVRRMLNCPICDDHAVTRLPSGPHVKRLGGENAVPVAATGKTEFRALVNAVMSAIADAEDVGAQFPDEARRIHYDETPARSIRGQASVREALELLDEGILVLPVPGSDKKH